MISHRCTGNNLLNYMKQTSVKHDINIEYCRDRHDVNYLKWVGHLEFQGKTFRGIGSSKKNCIKNIFEPANDFIIDFIRGGN